jgi:type VI secretion system protein ImpK
MNMSKDDPFSLPEKDNQTVLRPTPGGVRHARPASPSTARNPHTEVETIVSPYQAINPLVAAASSLLVILSRLRAPLFSHSDPAELRLQLIKEIKSFETQAKKQGQVDSKTVLDARYVLCTALDEAVLNTPWGRQTSEWHTHGLLITFHQDARGGEEFFALLNERIQDPTAHLYLLELMYLCLALGFEGRYQKERREELEEQRAHLFHVINTQRTGFERELSPHWHGVMEQRNPVIQYTPLWVILTVVSALLVVIYLGFSLSLNRKSDPVFTQLHALRNEIAPLAISRPASPPAASEPSPRLSDLLKNEVRQGLVEIVKDPDCATCEIIRIQGDNLFSSGSSQINDEYLELLAPIGNALNDVAGEILITGHSDNVRIRTLRFPSNWHLSQARADAIKERLAESLHNPNRLRAEGRAATERLVPNDTPANRARNRRVEIIIKYSPDE